MELVLANKINNEEPKSFSSNHILAALTTPTLRVVALLFTFAFGLKANDESMFEFAVTESLIGDAGLDGTFSALLLEVGRDDGEFRTLEEPG